jgi:hypothetical protein
MINDIGALRQEIVYLKETALYSIEWNIVNDAPSGMNAEAIYSEN